MMPSKTKKKRDTRKRAAVKLPGPVPPVTSEAEALLEFLLRAGFIEVTPAAEAFFRKYSVAELERLRDAAPSSRA
ncbi:MAG: hypothetical protein JNJ54_25945 [Myxococcaceae bacterium]|nr:hypothetical protein [Myxococcaceae bacterium]